MVASYGGDPSTDAKDAVRFLVGDTTDGSFLLQDEEIAYLLTQYSAPVAAAVAAADALSARFARESDELSGDLMRKCSQKSKAYKALADSLRKQANDPLTAFPIPFAGGTSCNDIESREQDTDRYPDVFNIGENDSIDGIGLKEGSDLRNPLSRF